MKITLKTLMICFLLFSCKETTKESYEKTNKSEVLNEERENLASSKEEITSNSKDDIKIKFSDLTISIKDIEMSWKDQYNTNDNIYETEQDTAFFHLDPPSDELFEKLFEIEQDEFDEIELYGQIEIKVAITSKQEIEVPFCVLEDWKSYTSKWSKLKINGKELKFPMIEEKTARPINFTIDELKHVVEKHCGIEWLNEIRKIESLDKIPISFFTTKYIYKIKVRNSKTNKIIEKFIVFYPPTSC